MNYIDDTMLNNIANVPKYYEAIFKKRNEIRAKFLDIFEGKNIKRVYLLGHGSTNYATIAIKYMLVKYLGLDVSHDVATIFNNYEGFNEKYESDEMLLICPAATGRTIGPVLAAREAKKRGIKVLGSGNISDGVLARECDVFIDKLTGNENAYVDTKGHSATLFLYALGIIEVANELGLMPDDEYNHHINALDSIIKNHNKIFKLSLDWYEKNSKILLEAKVIKIISFGINYSTAMEGALKISESTERDATGYDLEQFLHGPNMSSNSDDVFIFVSPIAGIESKRLMKTHNLMYKEGFCKSYVLSDFRENEEEISGSKIDVPLVDLEYLSYIQLVIPFQVIAARLALDLGKDTRYQPESFVNVVKVLKTSFQDY